MIKGLPVSKGIVMGFALVTEDGAVHQVVRKLIDENEVQAELDKFKDAVKNAEESLDQLRNDVEITIGKSESEIFAAHIHFLKDPSFQEDVFIRISESKANVEAAVVDSVSKFNKLLSLNANKGPYDSSPGADIIDVGNRILMNLNKQTIAKNYGINEETVIVSKEITPSTAAYLELQNVGGFVTERGGKFSHVSTLARAMRIPAVVNVKDVTRNVKTGDRIIVDGITGTIFVNPDEKIVEEYKILQADLKTHLESLKVTIDLPCMTLDGTRIQLMANIGKVADAEAALVYNTDGVGLYRTEFAFMIRDRFPTEEEQYQLYKQVVEKLHPEEVVIRVLDLGSDKELSYFPMNRESNPALGQRGIRFLLNHEVIFRTQLRAILRVNSLYPLSILVPMITDVEEIVQTKSILKKEMDFLKNKGHSFDQVLKFGVMIEVPSAALQIDRISKEVDFFSIGTNDLIQYTLASDRLNHESESKYEELHPSILYMIKLIVESAKRESKDVSICGDMAGDNKLTKLLLGLGLKKFSVSIGEFLEIKKAILETDLDKAVDFSNNILQLDTTREIRKLLEI